MGISEARSAARALHVRIREGADPIADRRRQRTLGGMGTGVATLSDLLAIYDEKVGKLQKRWNEARRRIEKVFKSQLRQPLSLISARDMQLAADAYPAQMSASAAVRYLRPILKWAAPRGYVDLEAARIYPPVPIRRRTRVLSAGELAALLPVLRAANKVHAAALNIMLLTLARREEVVRASWRQIDVRSSLWTIPETKAGEPHVIPLSQQALALVQARMENVRDPDRLIFCTASGGALSNWDRETKVIQSASGIVNWTRHDLRRTGATLLGELGEVPDIVEAALNHVSIRSSLAATYNRARYRPQVASALQRLANLLDTIEVGTVTVIPFAARS